MTTTAAPTRNRTIPSGAHTSFVGQVRAEWIKLTSLRSTPWIIGTTIVVMVGLAALAAWSFTLPPFDPETGQQLDAVAIDPSAGVVSATAGNVMGQIVIAVLGVMIISGEYTTGQIRSTIAASPKRLPVLAAKAVVTAVVAALTGVAGVALSVLVTTPILGSDGAIDLAADGTLRSLLGVPLYLVTVALTALGVGAILRHTAGGIAVAVVLYFVLPIVGVMISAEIVQDIANFLPSNAGQRLIDGDIDGAALTPWAGFGVAAAWSAAALVAAAVLLRRRDA